MSSSLDVLRGTQEPQILHLPPGVVSLDAATEAIELAESCGLFLDESQCITLEAAMGERADHKWAAFEVLDVEPRQSGKNDTVMVAEAHGLFIAGDILQLHTAHEAATVNESFLRMEEFIGNNPELKAQVQRFRYGNGDHAVELKSGGRLLYKTRTGGAARGFAGASRLTYDEALFLQAKHVAASLATLARGKTRAHNPQVWSLSSAALASSSYLHESRRRALAGGGGRFAYVEHTAEVCTLLPDGRIESNRGLIDLDDRRFWAIANPAMNHPEHGISEEFIADERRMQMIDEDGWARERLGFFDPSLGNVGKPPKLPAIEWELAATRATPPDGEPVTMAYEVSLDGEWSSIVVAAGDQQAPYVEQIEHRKGVGWLPERLVELVRDRDPSRLACVGSGPAGAQVGPVMLALSEAGLDTPLEQLSMVAYRQACGAFYSDVVEGRLSWFAGGGPLDLAAKDAAARTYGDAWSWDIRNVTVPISPLVAATVARALLPVAAPREERKARVHSF